MNVPNEKEEVIRPAHPKISKRNNLNFCFPHTDICWICRQQKSLFLFGKSHIFH